MSNNIFNIKTGKIYNKFYFLYVKILFYLKVLCEKKQTNFNNKISFIIFSKDRAMQLHALVSSLINHVSGDYDIHILYSTSDDDYELSYKQLINMFLNRKNVKFYKQGDSFKNDFNYIVASLTGDGIFFLVDDIIVIRAINLLELQDIDLNKEIFSLRHGNHLSYSYVVSQHQQLPIFSNHKKDFLTWKWQEAKLDWAYPLSVDGHLFKSEDVRFWVKYLRYKSPNSFEHTLQLFKSHYINYTGVCKKGASIFNNPCNKVQSEVANVHGGIHQSELNKLWQQGYIIDYKILQNYPNTSVHEEVNFTLTKIDDFG